MIAFLKSNTLLYIKRKIILLYILNVIDIVFTLALLETGLFQEVNILMINAVKNIWVSLGIKVVIPAILLTRLYGMIKDSDEGALRVSNIAINIALSIYSLVIISHLIWTAMLPFLIQYV